MNVFTEEKICLLFFFGLAGAAAPAVSFPTVFGGPQQSLPTENQSTLGGGVEFTPTAWSAASSSSGYISSMLSSASLNGVVEAFMIISEDVGKHSRKHHVASAAVSPNLVMGTCWKSKLVPQGIVKHGGHARI
jgi:hypothetical protein